MKRIYIVGGLILLFLLFGWISGYRLTESSALPWKAQVIRSEATAFGKAVLFEEPEHDSFGVARIKQYLGFLYRYDGSTRGYAIEEGKPFQATGFGTNDGKDSFLVAVKTAGDSNIQSIAIGNHLKDLTPSDRYHLTMESIKDKNQYYHLAEVFNGYALFVLDGYTEENWTIRAFDDEGKLIADKLFGAEIRYLDW